MVASYFKGVLFKEIVRELQTIDSSNNCIMYNIYIFKINFNYIFSIVFFMYL